MNKVLIKVSESGSVVSDSLRPHGLFSPCNSPGQNTGVGSLSLLQRIFPTQGSNPGLQHCRRLLYQLNHKASPRILEWVKIKVKLLGCVRLFETPRTVAHQASPSMEFSTGVGSLSVTPRDPPNRGIELGSPALQADSLPTELLGKPCIVSCLSKMREDEISVIKFVLIVSQLLR